MSGNGETHAFLFKNGAMLDLGARPGSGNEYGIGFAIDSFDNVAGTSRDHAFLYTDGTMFDLNNLVDPTSGWHPTPYTVAP